MAIGKKQVPLVLMQVSRPARVIILAQSQHRTQPKVVRLDIAVPGKDRLRILVLGRASNEIADVVVPEAVKIVRRQSSIRWADQDLGSVQFLRQGLVMPEGKINLAAEVGGQPHKFERTAIIGGNLHWKPSLMIVREHVESDAMLFEVPDALGAFGFQFGLLDGREEQRRENRDDHHDQQEFKQRRGFSSFDPGDHGLNLHLCERLASIS